MEGQTEDVGGMPPQFGNVACGGIPEDLVHGLSLDASFSRIQAKMRVRDAALKGSKPAWGAIQTSL